MVAGVPPGRVGAGVGAVVLRMAGVAEGGTGSSGGAVPADEALAGGGGVPFRADEGEAAAAGDGC